jgi:LPS sulfotransferase NodH
MEANQIFQNLQETQFLQKLSYHHKIIFIGEANTISYLQDFFNSKNGQQTNYYCNWDNTSQSELLIDPQQLIDCQAVVIASINNEHTIFETLKNQFINLNPKIPVLKLFTDLFVNLMAGQKLLQSSDYQIQLPQNSYAIITTPRSGSNFLCSILNSTNIAGYPKEHLRQPSVVIAKNCHFDYIRLLKILMTYQVTPNSVFGTKFISHFLKDFQQTQFDFDQIFQLIPKYIYLVRRDKIAQAVSVVVAQITNVWHIDNSNRHLDYQTKLQTIDIDEHLLQKVHRNYRSLEQGEVYLNQLFKRYQISPLRIEYEQLLENKTEQVQKIFDYLNIEYSQQHLADLQSTFKKTSSSLSEQIISKYQEKYLDS